TRPRHSAHHLWLPDVVFFERVHDRPYVAVGDPGVVDVFDTKAMEKLGSIATEKGAHTFALAAAGNQLYAFLPATHRAAIYEISDYERGPTHEKSWGKAEEQCFGNGKMEEHTSENVTERQ